MNITIEIKLMKMRLMIPVVASVVFFGMLFVMPSAQARFISLEETYELAKQVIMPKADIVGELPVEVIPLVLSNQEKDLITKTIWGEARNQSLEGQIAVAEVILKRLRNSNATVEKVIKAKKQFSCWNPRDPNRRKMQNLKPSNSGYQTARAALERALKGENPLTKGADHYHTKRVKPRWARGQKPVVTIGSHHFYSINA